MLWPKELIALLARGMDVTPVEGLTADDVYRVFLDEVARRAVWRAAGNAALLGPALRMPFTPIGSITTECVNNLVTQFCLTGPRWGDAVDAIYEFMENHADTICANFKDEEQPYHCDFGFEHIFGRGTPPSKDP
jgi:hypothetical protein